MIPVTKCGPKPQILPHPEATVTIDLFDAEEEEEKRGWDQ